jgi:hypothetical protein
MGREYPEFSYSGLSDPSDVLLRQERRKRTRKRRTTTKMTTERGGTRALF